MPGGQFVDWWLYQKCSGAYAPTHAHSRLYCFNISMFTPKLTRSADHFLMRLCVWACLLFASLAGANARAAVFNFNGGDISGCTLSSNTYTCSSFPLPASTDTMAIASGYTVLIKTSVSFDYNQGLAMSGTATLNVTGNLNIADINPPNLSIKGGNLISSGTFAVGNQAQTITANVSAATMTLGTGKQTSITGNVNASGTITIGSHCTVTGSVSGATVNTNSPSTIDGDVNATVSFTLASGSKVSGNIVAPTVSLLPSNSIVGGNISAKTSLRLGDSVSVNGDVSTGNLTLDSADAIIYGNATVDKATLNWAGRVVKTIYCTGGTTSGQCDCVTNNSGYPVNSVSGPHCAAVPPAIPIDHFLILHDGTASACTPEPVTVKACADAACASYYKGGVNLTLQPGGGSFAIGASGVSTDATVSQSSTGNVILNVSASSVAVANPVQCDNTTDSAGAGSAYCGMNFNNSIGLSLSVPDQYAAVTTGFSLAAVVLDPNGKSCKPAYPGKTQPVQLSCAYANPARGSQPLTVSSDGAGFSALNANNASTGLCDGSARSFNVSFPANGSAATLSMNYADVGQLRIDASVTDNGKSFGTSGKFIVAPNGFKISSFPATTTAGVPFNVIATALTAAGLAAPNFGLETADPAIAAETVQFSLGALGTQGCKLTASVLGSLSPPPTTSVINTGILGKLSYTEAGALNIQVQQASSYYLGGAKPRPLAVQTSAASGCGAIASTPAWFQVKEGRVGAGLPNFYYSGEPLDLSVTAMNALGNRTLLYDSGYGYSNPVVFAAWDAAGAKAIAAADGALSGAGAAAATPLPASAFAQGIASLSASSAAPLVFTFASAPHAPMQVRLRATEAVSGNAVSSANAATYNKTAEDVYNARSGRLAIASRFGSATGDLALPVSFQYWTGASWIRNVDESDGLHRLSADAFAIQATAPLSQPTKVTQGRLTIDRGLGSVTLRPTGGTGTATVAINLGGGATDTSCLPVPPARPVSIGAVMPYLRGPNGVCTGADAPSADPVARATFGATAPEAKRIIHTREVFN